MNSNISNSIGDLVFSEGWVGVCYIFSIGCILDGTGLDEARMRNDFRVMYDAAKLRRSRRLPRGIAVYIIIPVYCATSFNKDILSRLRLGRKLGWWGVLVKPVLYNCGSNSIEFIEGAQNDNLMHYETVRSMSVEIILDAVKRVGNDMDGLKDPFNCIY